MNGLQAAVSSAAQEVVLSGNGVPYSLHRLEVNIHSSIASRLHEASGKVRVSTITNQNWDPKRFHGNIVASNSQYLAYVLESRSGYVIRLIQLATKDRTLLKKFTGQVVDISFAHKDSNMLAAVDEGGNLFVYDLDIARGDISLINNCLKLYIFRGTSIDGKSHRLMWCPYVNQQQLESSEDHDENLVIAVSHNSRVEVFDLPEIAQRYSSGISLDFNKMERGITFIANAHNGSVTDMAFSPDCNVLATAGDDGHLKFWELNHEAVEETTKCLHDYMPHNGAPVTRLMFLDNYTSPDPSAQFWRFLVTASLQDSEIKIWCTVKWKCLQSLKFLPPVNTEETRPHMLLTLDLSSSYLIAADTVRSVLYVLAIRQAPAIGEASFSSITEYVLTQPILSFVLSGVTTATDDEESEEDEEQVFNPHRNVVLLQLHCIQTKSMQELLVTFEPPDLTGIPPAGIQDDIDSSTDLVAVTQIPPSVASLELLQVDSHEESTVTSLETSPINATPLLVSTLPALKDISSTAESNSLYGPGQSSPAVKLLSPVSFLTPPSMIPASSTTESSLLRSPSDFGSASFPHSSYIADNPTATTVSSSDGAAIGTGSSSSALVALPLSTSDSKSLDGEIVMSPSSSLGATDPFPSALKGMWRKQEEIEQNEEEWPALHVVPKDTYTIPNSTDIEEGIKRKASTLVANVIAAAVEAVSREEELTADKSDTSEDDNMLQSVLDQLLIHQEEIQSLKHQQEMKFEEMTSHFNSQLHAANESVIGTVQDLLKEQNHRLEKLIKSTDIKRNDRLSQVLSQAVQSNIAGRLEKSVKNETKNAIIPAVQKSFGSTQEMITRAINEQMSTTSAAINTHLHQILHTEGLVQSIANAVAGVMPHVLPVVMETLFKTTLLPAFERSCQQMFRQLDESFRQGTSEYLSQLNEQQGRGQETALLHQVTTAVQSLMASLNSPTSPIVHVIQTCIHSELATLLPHLQESLKDSLVETMKSELVTLFDEKSSSSQQQQQERLVELVEKKEFDTAFNLALSTSNLHLVTFLCHHVSPEEVFDTNSQCPLSQPVLLSLIQQVAVDLSEDVEMKIKYLEHAILSLDPGDHVTSAHLPTVMQLLADQLVKTEQQLRDNNEGSAPLLRAMKRVRMLSEHVCRSSSASKQLR